MLSPREKWLVARAHGERILDIGFVSEHDRPNLHIAIRQMNPGAEIIGIDLKLDRLRRLALSGTVNANAMALPFAFGSFELAILAEVIEHLHNPWSVFVEVRRVLASGGLLLLTTPSLYEPVRHWRHWLFAPRPFAEHNYRQFLDDKDHRALWDPLSLCNLLAECDLKVVEMTTKQHHVPILARWVKALRHIDLPFYPFTRWGANLCLKAVRQ
jgi:SAM-dependent methyltransferase